MLSCYVLLEVLWYRKSHVNRESNNEFGSEAVQIAKLKETKSCRTCIKEK